MDTDDAPRYFVKWFPPDTFTGDYFAVIDGQEGIEVDSFPVVTNALGELGAQSDARDRARALNDAAH